MKKVKLQGSGRMADNEKAILLIFNRPLTEDELRALHNYLCHFEPSYYN